MNASKFIRLAVSSAFAAAITLTASSALYTGVTNASSLYLRATPGGEVIGSIPNSSKIAVIDNYTDPDWYQIAVGGQTGYASRYYIEWTYDADFNLGVGIVQCDTSVNVRSQPSTDSEVLTSLSNGAKVDTIGISNGWYKVSVNSTVGYIHPDYLSITGGRSTSTSRGSDTSALRQSVVDFAAQFLGTPYVYGGSTPSGFDCSGFTSYVYKNTVRSIARTSSEQRNTTTNISMDELKPGDLVFFGSGNTVSHVGIYVGNGEFIHSPHTGSSVKYDTLWSGNYNRRFICGGRVIND